jgi:hypothetical protein
VTDDLQATLADLPRATAVPRPPGYVAILREEVPEDEREAADAWVTANGGRIHRAPPVRFTGRETGRQRARTAPGGTYYLVPSAALRR